MSRRHKHLRRWTYWLLALAALVLLVGCTAVPAARPVGTATQDLSLTQPAPLIGTPRPASLPEDVAAALVSVVGASARAELAGTGVGTTASISLTSRVNRLMLTHDGSNRFVVLARYPNGSSEYLLNAQGRYRGSRLMLSSRAYFEIEADGPWTVHVAPVGVDEAAGVRIAGAGDTVSNWFTPPAQGMLTYAYTHHGTRNFYVQIHCDAGALDHIYAIDEVGAIDDVAEVEFDQGPCLWDVQADGDWQITVAP